MDISKWKEFRAKVYGALRDLTIQLIIISITTYAFLWGWEKYGFERTIIVLLSLILLRLNTTPKPEPKPRPALKGEW